MNEVAKNQLSPRRRLVNFLVHLLLAILAVIWILPIFWIVLTSFRAEPGAYTNTFLPQGYTFNNYIKLFTDRNVLNFPKMFMNTFIIAIFTCFFSTFFVLSVSYSLSRMRFAFRRPYMNIAMILGLFPGFMAMVAQYFILKAMGLTEGSMIRIGLIIVYSACTGLGFQIAKGFFDIHLSMVYMLCSRCRGHFDPDRYLVHLYAAFLCRRNVRSCERLTYYNKANPFKKLYIFV